MRFEKRLLWGRQSEEGGSMVEMALVSALVYLPMLFGIFEVSYGLFAYNFVCNASRQASRYASVRGNPSCIIAPTFVDSCLGPSGSKNPTSTSGSTTLQNYVKGLGYGGVGIDESRVTVTASWLAASLSSGTGGATTTTWVACPTGGDSAGNTECNSPGDAVQGVVSYNFPLPFWTRGGITLHSSSMMVINE